MENNIKNKNFINLFKEYIKCVSKREKITKITDDIEYKKEYEREMKIKVLEAAKNLDEIKKNQKELFKNAWLDIFPIIISYHPKYFKQYFSNNSVKKYFKTYIVPRFIDIMKIINSYEEEKIINYTQLDKKDNKDGTFTITQYWFAKNYYKAIKSVKEDLAKEIYEEAKDGYLIYLFQQGFMPNISNYTEMFKKLSTTNGKMLLITKIMENIKVDFSKPQIIIAPLLKFKDDLLKIFELCIVSENKILVNYLGEYLEYLLTFNSIPEIKNLKKDSLNLLNKYENIDVAKQYKKNIMFVLENMNKKSKKENNYLN